MAHAACSVSRSRLRTLNREPNDTQVILDTQIFIDAFRNPIGTARRSNATSSACSSEPGGRLRRPPMPGIVRAISSRTWYEKRGSSLSVTGSELRVFC
jgi:hypothetical protein